MGQKHSAPAALPEKPEVTKNYIDPISCVYAVPPKKDIAVCFVYFNPAQSKRILMNYLYTVEKMKMAKIPVFTMELVFNAPEIVDAFHVKGKSVMFHKERLCKLLEKRIPWRYRKLLFLDADIIFANPNWYSDLSRRLDSYEVVHPFSSACWLDITYSRVEDERLSVLYMDRTKPYNPAYHPGFGWAFQRSWFRRIGFYVYGVTGSGDTLSASAWLGTEFALTYLRQAFRPSYAEYKENPLPSISCIGGTIYHLWHGNRKNRKYQERHTLVDGVDDIRTRIMENRDGVFEFNDHDLQQKIRGYFEGRDDDGL
jgi:hypothetical protein